MRTERDSCGKVAVRLALGEPVDEQREQEHLQHCASCRELAKQLAHVKQNLAASARIEPPAWLDEAVRAGLLEPPLVIGSALRPTLAAGLAVAAFVALVGGLAGALAQSGAAERGPVIAIAIATIYLSVSFAATLPLLLRSGARQSLGRPEAGS